ncbi:hypothetical protein [Alicyclobacillus acidocaldarius]|uniref:hypothetical protein n=1 Tax=Alicyclobacillus acidocaldarius TaxID=405212 RepID=UPI001C54C297|nr:hypothetical protein [Alicyclobacillus acidocaldarius]
MDVIAGVASGSTGGEGRILIIVVIMIIAVDMWTTPQSRRNIHAQPVDNFVDKSADLRCPPVDNLCFR